METLRFLTKQQVETIKNTYTLPVYVYSEAVLRQKARECLNFPNAYGLTVRYAMKANSNLNILKIFASERPAIINKAVYHYCRLRTNNYIFSANFEINQMFDECQTTQAPLITKNDIVEKFISSKLEVTGNTDDYLFTKDIYSMCQHFCSIHRFPNIEQKELTSSIKIALGCTIQSSKKRAPGHSKPLNVLLGLRIKN